jgi:Zn-dependent protease
VLLYEPEQTPYDLRFRLFGIRVRVHPLFWLITALLGWNQANAAEAGDKVLLNLALWVACVFVSILLHELGHVLTGRLFGSDGHIVLYSFGGLAVGASNLRPAWQRVLVYAAGPAVQLALFAAIWGALLSGWVVERGTPLALIVGMLLWINLAWPILNLLPIWPLDGGQITREICSAASRTNGVVISLWISLVVSAALAVNAVLGMNGRAVIPYMPVSTFMAIFFGLFAYSSFQALQMERSRGRFWDEDWPER